MLYLVNEVHKFLSHVTVETVEPHAAVFEYSIHPLQIGGSSCQQRHPPQLGRAERDLRPAQMPTLKFHFEPKNFYLVLIFIG